MLEKLLRSIRKQKLPTGVTLEVIVVDNDAEASALPIVQRFSASNSMSFHYYRQPVKNISLTRNLAVEKATGSYLLFIDDDEVASSEWVAKLLDTLNRYDADGVFGLVIPEFNKATPNWLRRSEFYYSPMTDTGTEAKFTWTSNCLIKAELLKEMNAPFDPAYGITGGGDTHLFQRLKSRGAKFVYCYEAWVSEYLPPDRTTLSYLIKRAMKGSNAHTRRLLEAAGSRRTLVGLFMLAKAISFGSLSLMLMVMSLPDSRWRTKWMIRLASNISRFLTVFGWRFIGYPADQQLGSLNGANQKS